MTEESPAAPTSRDWPLMLAVVLASSVVVLDGTLITIAVPELAQRLHVSVGAIGWVVAAYALAICCTLPLTGWAARRFGERRVWMVALAVFTMSLFGASMSWDYASLLGFRITQGMGSAMIVPVGQMLLARQVGPTRMSHALAVTGFAVGVVPVFGPSIAGAAMTVWSWRAVFLIGVPMGLAAIAVSWLVVPNTQRGPREPLDVWSAVLGAGAIGGTIFGLSSWVRTGRGWLIVAAICTVGGLALCRAFVVRVRGQARPLLDLSLPSRRPYSLALSSYVLLGFAFHAGMVVLPWELIAVRGISPGDAGLLMTAQGVGATAVMLPVRGMLARFGSSRTTILGLGAGAASMVPLALWSGSLSLVAVVVLIAVRGFGLGAVFVSAQGAAYEAVDLDEVTSAAPQINISSRLGGAFGVAVCTMVVDRAAPAPGVVTGSAVSWAWWVVVAAAALGIVPALLAARESPRLLLVEPAGHVDRLAGDEAGSG